jgi:GrpB-like predicted nucleotidyltransferase (UPF0157 family)
MSRKLDFFKVIVVPHDPNWRSAFETESKLIALALKGNAVAIHHIGSTAIPQIHAKPIIDMLVEVKDLMAVDTQGSVVEALGYQAMGEFGISGRRFFRKGNEAGIRTHHIHTFEVDSPQIERHLKFRDYMISNPEDAQQYSELKQQLANKYSDNIQGYMDGKAGFIKDIDLKAAKWRLSH